jgi:hypothetical protein
MKSSLIIFISLLSFNFFGQTPKISDLLNLLSKDIDNCDTWALKNGFKSTSDKNSKDENCEYFFAYNLKDNSTIDLAFYKCIYNGYSPNVALRSRSEKEYLTFKEEAKTLGFVYKETITSDNGKLIYYSLIKGSINYELSISTTNYEGFNLYEVDLSIIND